MTSVVRFRTGDGNFAVAIEQVREVRSPSGMRPIPSWRPGVVGMLAQGDEVLTVVAALGSGRQHVLVLDGGETTFGLLVEEVTGVAAVEARQFGPPPAGQVGNVISGVIAFPDDVVLLVDAAALGRTLEGGEGP